MASYNLTHLRALEAESIHLIREVTAECEKPVMLYSVGKDSTAMLRVAQKAFAPAPIPFPMMHVDTTFKFPEMIRFRDEIAKRYGLELIVWKNEDALAKVGARENWTCSMCANLLKTQALIQALKHHGFDAAFGGARRDEERSRAKERMLSFRDEQMQWDPKNQRPELWNLYNTRIDTGESFRVFPMSNWTELDIWHYIHAEQLDICHLYFAREREVIRRDGVVLAVAPEVQPRPGEKVEMMRCRFRSLGCQLCTGVFESEATTLDAIIEEMMLTRRSERENRAVDRDRDNSMEDKKREGYF